LPLLFAVAERRLGALKLRQVEHERDASRDGLIQARGAQHDGRPAAILAEVLLFVGLCDACLPQFGDGFCVALPPVRRRELRSTPSTRKEFLALIPDNAEEGVV